MHSRFSPSSLSRVKACPPSFFGQYNIESSFASEVSIRAHSRERAINGDGTSTYNGIVVSIRAHSRERAMTRLAKQQNVHKCFNPRPLSRAGDLSRHA